ncbi:hypothetical protein K437DRAFT_60175 [Tilletiaria anomala UBC 951]|uniref:K Homology domain-containing protein n=1 Tax=Tilletiaria anomala (strain ATCC 24038 / CBS 436.72 / UBC 951) TaxID=1037660 RepID=A0A066WAS6_TILAU|nr:uncharacterized protein K437DRAFT_60175 [Tilletiaria anomala UBC 951]KDN50826.1 hypothetical protein K437DRAFT_60175 [Tilletiaria anomala UBC 951]
MDVYCLAFTFPKAGGPFDVPIDGSSNITLPGPGSASTVGDGHASQQMSAAPTPTTSVAAAMGMGFDLQQLNHPSLNAARELVGSHAQSQEPANMPATAAGAEDDKSSAARAQQQGHQQPPSSASRQQQPRKDSAASTSGNRATSALGNGFSSMRSRFPPSVKAFMPSAFGGSKRTNDRILEGVTSAGERSAEGEGECEQNATAAAPAQEQAAAAEGNSKPPAPANGEAAPSPFSAAHLMSGASGEDERVDRSSAPPGLDKAVGGASSLRDSSPPGGPAFSRVPGAGAVSGYNNRDSRSTVGTGGRLSFDQTSSSTSFSTDSVTNFGQFGSGAGSVGGSRSRRHYSSEPTSVSHSAANSLSVPGGPGFSSSAATAAVGTWAGANKSGPSDLEDSIFRLASDVMSTHQCLVSVTDVQPEPQANVQGSSPAIVSTSGSLYTPSHKNHLSSSSVLSASMPSLLPFPSSTTPSQGSAPLPHPSMGSGGSSSRPSAGYPYQHHQIQPIMLSDAKLGSSSASIGPVGGASASAPRGSPFPSGFGLTLSGPGSASNLSLASSLTGQSPSFGGNTYQNGVFGYSPAAATGTGAAASGNVGNGNGNAQNAAGAQASGAAAAVAPKYCFFLSGGYQQVMAARGAVLRDHPFQTQSRAKVPMAELLDTVSAAATLPGGPSKSNGADASNGAASGGTIEVLKPEVRKRLDEIAALTHAHIAIVSHESRGVELGYGLETERNVELVITGSVESIELARVRLLVFLDELNGLHSEACELDYKLHNIIGGRKRCVIQTIQEETAANIYFPSCFSGVLGPSANGDLLAQQNTVYITGEYFSVQRARDMLFQVSLHKSKCIISRDTAILPRKLDWLLTERMDELKTIVTDNGTFISFPPLGMQSSLITVFGDNRVSIERTIRSVMALVSQYYVASIWLIPTGFDVFMAQQMLNVAQVTPALKHISTTSGAELVFKSNCFEVHGLEGEVRSAVAQLLDLDLVKPFNFEVRFQIELASEHRDFISGKKNGKINKIMKQCNARIKFETFNEYNFLIDVSGNDRTSALQGLSFLQEELPAEISFHVPEAYHKRIIGVGGKNIQRIMKKYGVYVKFSNAEEFAALGGYFDNEDNVVARTPAKNAINLEHLKQSVMEMVSPKDKDYTLETIPIARRYHRTLLGEKGVFLRDIESKTSTAIRFPPCETASDLVSIFGPESQLHIAAQMLLEHVPFEAEFRTPSSHNLAPVISSPEFSVLLEHIRQELNIRIVPVAPRPGSEEGIFKLRLNRSNCDYLPAARDLLEDFLISRNVSVYATALESRARSDSFASSLPHFATKLIAPAAAESVESFQEAARNHERRLRAAASTPDVKALFDDPRPTHHVHSSSQQIQRPAFSSSSAHPSPYLDRVTGFGSEVWGPPTPMTSQSIAPTPNTAVGSNGVQFPHHHPFSNAEMAHRRVPSSASFNQVRASDASHFGWPKQGSEGAQMYEDRIASLRKPRTFSNRAQSLDIGALTAQQAQAASVLRPYGAQMITFGGAHGGNNPHQYGHGAQQSISRLPPASTGVGIPASDTMAEVSRVLSSWSLER